MHLLHQDVVGGRFDGDALVLVGHLDIMDPNVLAPHVNSVEAAPVAPSDDHVVYLAIRARVERQMECGSCRPLAGPPCGMDGRAPWGLAGPTIHERDVVNREIGAPVQPKQSRTIFVVLVKLVTVSLYGALGVGAIEFEVGGVADHEQVSSGCARPVNDPFQVNRDPLPVLEHYPSSKTVVPRGNKDCRLVSCDSVLNKDTGCVANLGHLFYSHPKQLVWQPRCLQSLGRRLRSA